VAATRALALELLWVPSEALLFHTGTSLGFRVKEVSRICGTAIARVGVLAALASILESTALVTLSVLW